MASIARRLLRDDIRHELRRRIIRGDIPVGTNINEPVIAEELGVSRTPLREALLGLEQEGLLEGRPGRGWWIAPLTVETVREVYPMISALEVLALESSDHDRIRATAGDLKQLNRKMRRAKGDVFASQHLDDEWHALLLSTCANHRLASMIAGLKHIVHRYEYAYMSRAASIALSVEQHQGIIEAIETGDLPAAVELLKANWLHSMRVLTDWLEQRKS